MLFRSGGITDARFAVAYAVRPRLQVGLAIHAVSGQNRIDFGRTFSDSSGLGSAEQSSTLNFGGRGLSLGVIGMPIQDLVIGASLPASRLAGIFDLVEEIALAPRVPDREVDRVKALRLAAIEQSQASPRARASEALIAEIYGASAAYSRPMGGTRESVAAISRDALMERHALLLGAGVPTVVIAGELEAAEVIRTVESSPLAQLRASAPAAPTAADAPSAGGAGTATAPRLLLLDRPGSVQSELRIGKVGRSRLDPLFYAALIHSEVLGGLFGSRLNRVLREEKGYTYGAAAGFEFRRGRGPFTARTAVESSVTAPALVEARA